MLDTSLATHAIGRLIMDKLSKCSRRAPNPTPPDGLKFGIQQNPMTPFKSIVWQRRAAAEADSQADTSAVEDVPYVLLYMTVRRLALPNSVQWSVCAWCDAMHDVWCRCRCSWPTLPSLSLNLPGIARSGCCEVNNVVMGS